MTPTGIRGVGQTSPRTDAIKLFKDDFSIRRISEMLDVTEVQVQEWVWGKPTRASRGRRSVSPASAAQRQKVKNRRSITGAEGPCDPAHICPRGLGGCDDPDCIVPLTREEHRAFDRRELDILRFLVPDYTAELCHALEHYRGDLISLLERVTSDSWHPSLRDPA